GEVWTGVLVNALWVAVSIGILLFVTGSQGAQGAAIAILIAYAVLLFVCVLVLCPIWSIPMRKLMPPVLLTVASLAIALSLALTPQIPPLVTALVCVALGLVAFLRWGLPTLLSRVRTS